ncbi:methyltransferase type 11, partial [gut metagenome]
MPLAKYCRSVMSLDLSAEMGKRLCKKAREQGVENIRFLQADWDTLDLRKGGLEKGFELVMSGLNPGINRVAALQKLCAASRKGCCLVTFDGPAENRTQQDLARLLYAQKPRQMVSGYNTEWPLRLLRELGYQPDRDKTVMAWTKTHTEQAAFRRLLADHTAAFKEHPERVDALREYVHQHLDKDGMFREHNRVSL